MNVRILLCIISSWNAPGFFSLSPPFPLFCVLRNNYINFKHSFPLREKQSQRISLIFVTTFATLVIHIIHKQACRQYSMLYSCVCVFTFVHTGWSQNTIYNYPACIGWKPQWESCQISFSAFDVGISQLHVSATQKPRVKTRSIINGSV